ncbi:MAG: DNA polymerase III subunit beta [Bilophila sp.]
MFLTVKKEDIIEGLQKAAGIIPTKTGAAYLRSLWMQADANTLTIMATDANIEFTGTYPAVIKTPGLVGINGRHFVDLLRRLPGGELHIRLDDTTGTLILEQGRRTYKLPANDPTWFQPFAPFAPEGSVVWSGDFFQEVIDRVFFCVSDDEASDAVSCLFLKSVGEGAIEVCGLNGHQFALTTFTHDDLAAHLPEDGILIQRKYVGELRKWLGGDEIELNITDKRLFVRSGDGRETLSLPRATYLYPDYSAFMARLATPDSSHLKLTRKECLDALDRISIFNTDTDRGTNFELSTTDAMLSAQGQDTGSASETLEVNYGGSLKHIAFPTKNLMEILTHYQSADMTFTLTTTEGPCGINGTEDPDYTVLIMPMKVADETYYEEK